MRAALALSLALAFASTGALPLAPQEPSPAEAEDFSARFEPDDPRAGEVVSLIVVAGERHARYLDSPRVDVDAGLELVGRSSRPRVLSSGERGAELELELKVLAPGARRVVIDLDYAGGRIRLGPYSFVAEDAARARPEGMERPAWRWSAPRSVLRLQAFRLALVPADGTQPEEAEAVFAAPPGLSLEPTGDLEWVGIALEEGDLLLPAASIRVGPGAAVPGKAAAELVRVSPLPAELAESRAIGDFAVSLEGPYPPRPSALSPFRVLVVVRGPGNHPAMEPPVPEFYLDGEKLGGAFASSRRLDESRPEGGTYAGRTTLELELAVPRAGNLEARWAPYPVLSPSGLRPIDLPALRVRVADAPAGLALDRGAGAAAASSGRADPFGDARTLAAAVGAERPALAALAGRLDAGDLSGAADLLESPAAARGDLADEVDYLRAALAWRSGEKGLALSIVYGFLRNPRGDSASLRRAEAAAKACAAELGSGPPILDSLPPPRPFLAAALACLALALALAAAPALAALATSAGSQRGPRRGVARRGVRRLGAALGAHPAPLALAAVFAVAAVASAAVGGASAAQRTRPFAVVWADRALTVPSEKAEFFIPLPRGSAARVRAGAPGYAGIVLADGAAGWARREDLYFY